MTPQFPLTRMRRNRKSPWALHLVAENVLSVHDLIYPLFIHRQPNDLDIPIMPGVQRLSIPSVVAKAKKAYNAGIQAIILFPSVDPALKSEDGKEAYNPDSCICEAISRIKDAVPELGIMADVALDPYTTHGHDGVTDAKGYVDNDRTVEILCKQALALAQAGCDVVAPSDMMDGRIGAIRRVLEAEGLYTTQIMSYAAKYASQFYGPFRDAVGSKSNLGKADKKTYQMDYANVEEALLAVDMSIAEGADMIVVKPGTPYLDVLSRVSQRCALPVIPYQISGEYAIIKMAAQHGLIDSYEEAMMELLVGMKRAGARAIITYGALEMARYLG